MSSASAALISGRGRLKTEFAVLNRIKSVLLSILMISMSLSVGIVGAIPSPENLDEASKEFDVSIITESVSSGILEFSRMLGLVEEEPGELEQPVVDAMLTGGRSVPSISYSPSTFNLVRNTAMNTQSPTSTGGAVTSWTISPSLPSGISISSSTGTISGTPTVLSSSTSYTVTANNGAGSDTATIIISVTDALPVIVYSPNSFTEAVGTAMTSVTPQSYSGTVDSYTISPSLPSGLSLNSVTGTLSGTPTAVSASTTYTVTATNSAGADTATLTIVVNDVAPTSITYSPNSFTLTKGTAMTTSTPTTSGGTVTTWSISPSLPSGLSLASSDGAISGTPSVVSSLNTYTVTGTNTGGSVSTTITIQVNDIAPIITYSSSSLTLTKGTAMSDLVPTSSGGTVISYSVSPTLPAGLSFDSSTGKISSTPTAVTASGLYTITATNTGGTDTASITIQVNDVQPLIGYTPNSIILSKGAAMSTASPTLYGSGIPVSWSVSPSLPAGISLDASTGDITGTPTAITASTVYTITATNTGGSDTATLTIVVNDATPSIAFSPNSLTLIKDSLMTTATPSSTGGAVLSWSITPPLPSSLSFDTSTGAISGTPTVISSSTVYTVTASNSGGSDSTTITIVINDIPPSTLAYSGSPFTLTKDSAMTAATPTSSGGAVVSYSVSPTLPAGLSMDTSTGVISGTPTAVTSSATYTITGTNSGGGTTTTVDIVVNDVVPSSISYSGTPFTLTKDSAMTAATPTSSGGTVISWSISPTLPAGLAFDTSTCEISGTPTAITSTATYTITATNTGCSATTTVDITVNDEIPSSVAYSGTPFTLTKDSAMTAATPT